MGCVYILRDGIRNVFKIGRTKGPLKGKIKQPNDHSCTLAEFARIETKDHIACEAFLHQRLRSRRVIHEDGSECFEVGTSELKDAICEAEDFVAEFLKTKAEAEELSTIEEDSTSNSVKPSSSDLEFYSKLLKVRDAQDRLKIRREFYESKLKISIGRASSLRGLATWKGHWYQHFDLRSFRDADNDLYKNLFQMFGSESYKRTFCIKRIEK
jgi:hypothetical protein